MHKDYIEMLKRVEAERQREETELLVNPLSKYSTKQLKEELKRRKQV